MLQSARQLRGFKILAKDGEIGTVDEFYFEDLHWKIRYLVADTGGWLAGRRVLISPVVIGLPDHNTRHLPVALAKTQVENSPGVDADKPVSRQMEIELARYYDWPAYWLPGTFAAGIMSPLPVPRALPEGAPPVEGPGSNLRSTNEVTGYSIAAQDGEIGHVEDFLFDGVTWDLRYLVVDTRNWLPGRKVLVTPPWIERIAWAERKVHVDLLRETIRDGPEFDSRLPISREYEEKLHDYYGRPKYWHDP